MIKINAFIVWENIIKNLVIKKLALNVVLLAMKKLFVIKIVRKIFNLNAICVKNMGIFKASVMSFSLFFMKKFSGFKKMNKLLQKIHFCSVLIAYRMDMLIVIKILCMMMNYLKMIIELIIYKYKYVM